VTREGEKIHVAQVPRRSSGSFPAVCVASVKNRMAGSVSLVIRASWSTGKITPVSLLACMTAAVRVSGLSAWMKVRRSRFPTGPRAET